MLRSFGLFIIISFCVFIFTIEAKSFGEELDDLEDGAYSIEYVILHAETESVSIANDYFEKPATLFIEDGERYIQFPLNHSQWTKELEAPLGDSFEHVDVISVDEEEDTRIVEFLLDRDLSDPLEFKMHVLIEEMEPVYDHRYTVRFDFDEDTIEPLDNVERPESEVTNEDTAEADEKDIAAASVENADSGESSSNNMIWIMVGTIVIIVVGGLVYFMMRKTKNKK